MTLRLCQDHTCKITQAPDNKDISNRKMNENKNSNTQKHPKGNITDTDKNKQESNANGINKTKNKNKLDRKIEDLTQWADEIIEWARKTKNKEKTEEPPLNNNNNNQETEIIEVNWNKFIPVEQFEAKVNHVHLDEDKKEVIFNLEDEYGNVFAKNFDIGVVMGKDHEACIELI